MHLTVGCVGGCDLVSVGVVCGCGVGVCWSVLEMVLSVRSTSGVACMSVSTEGATDRGGSCVGGRRSCV